MPIPKTKWEDDEYLIEEELDETEELDEDEQYVLETESILEEDEEDSNEEYE